VQPDNGDEVILVARARGVRVIDYLEEKMGTCDCLFAGFNSARRQAVPEFNSQ